MTNDGKTVPSVSQQTGGLSGWGYVDKLTTTALDIFLMKEKAKAAANAQGVDRTLYTQQVEVPVNTAVSVDENKRTAQQGADVASPNVNVFGITMNRNLLIFSGVMLGIAVYLHRGR